MPDIEEQLQKKKPFKKKTYRSYLSLDETLDSESISVSTSTNLLNQQGTAVSNATVTISPKVNNEPKVNLSPNIFNPAQNIYVAVTDVIPGEKSNDALNAFTDSPLNDISPPTSDTHILKSDISSNKVQNSPKVNLTPQVSNSPMGIISPDVIFEPKVEMKPQVILVSKEIISPEVIYLPQDKNEPKVSISPTDNAVSPAEIKDRTPNSKRINEYNLKSDNQHLPYQHAAVDDINVHFANLMKGFTRVPNSILQVLISGELSKHELQTLAVILRLTIGFNREEAPISLGVIHNLTGIQTSRISAALNVLIEKNLIKRKSGTINSPNILSLIYSDDLSKVTLNPTKANISPKVRVSPKVEKSPETSGDKITEDLRSESHLQYINNKQKDSLSLSLEFKNNFILPLMKKDRERLFKLIDELKGVNANDIELVFEDVFLNKKDILGKSINSELGYLETCFFKHKDWLKSKLLKKQKAEFLSPAEQEQKKIEEEEAMEYNKRLSLFEKQFSSDSERLEQIEKYSRNMNGQLANYFPTRKVHAINSWYEEIYGAGNGE